MAYGWKIGYDFMHKSERLCTPYTVIYVDTTRKYYNIETNTHHSQQLPASNVHELYAKDIYCKGSE